MINADFLNQLGKFSLVIYKRVTSNYSGPRRSIAQGAGLVFKDHRIYTPGDDFRLIDWRVYARTDDLYIKNYEEERNLTVHVLVDYSQSMNFGKPITKFEYGSMLGLGFAYLALKENEKFQFSTFSEDLNVFQPRKGMSQLVSMLQHLNSIKPEGKSQILKSLMHYKKFLGTRSLVVLISDFLINLDEVIDSFQYLSKNEVKVIQVLDPVEKNLNLEGDYKLKDSESGDLLRTFISPKSRTEYQSMLDNHSAKIHETCKTLGYDFHLITTDKPIFDSFYEILK